MRKGAVMCVLLALAAPASAQTVSAAQFLQLRNYVIELAMKRNEDKEVIKALIAYAEDLNCRNTRTNEALAAATKQEPTTPVIVIYGKLCADMTSPAPVLPAYP